MGTEGELAMQLICRFVFILAVLGVCTPTWGINVSGPVSGLWTPANNPYCVVGDISIPARDTLVIQPGVRVIFRGHYKFSISTDASLEAVGTPADSIVFTALNLTAGWNGIRLNHASTNCRFEYCSFKYGHATGQVYSGGALYLHGNIYTVTNCRFDHCTALYGGAIYCSQTWTPITNCIFTECSTTGGGAAVYCYESGNLISGNIITSSSGDALTCGTSSSPIIQYNLVCDNSGSGISITQGGDPLIYGNLICGNHRTGYYGGGGISCTGTGTPSILGNHILDNTATSGGGIYVSYCEPYIAFNLICRNRALGANSQGGGIYLYTYTFTDSIYRNTICCNTSSGQGGGLYIHGAHARAKDCLVWRNKAAGGDQIGLAAGSSVHVGYSDVRGGWPGFTNFSTNPMVVDSSSDDMRLRWGSPCIDAGDPQESGNDPDGSRGDIGYAYLDQRFPVRVLLTPHPGQYQLPTTGGNLKYTVRLTNCNETPQTATVLCDLTLPNGEVVGPVMEPLMLTLAPGETRRATRFQHLAASAPPGIYHVNAYAAVAGDTCLDSFMFGKLDAVGSASSAPGDWLNNGEEFRVEDLVTEMVQTPQNSPLSEITLAPLACKPNPFNSATTINFELHTGSIVSLKIYDVAGRIVASLVDGWRDAGKFQIRFDGSNLPSGVYLCQLVAGQETTTGKVVLLK
jgi:hypothetical protein